MNSIMKKINAFKKDEKGVTMLEYALIAALVALVCITTMTNVGAGLNASFTQVVNSLTKVQGTATTGGAGAN